MGLRIFVVLVPSANIQVPGNNTWYRNLCEPLIDLHHDVCFMPAEEGYRAQISQNDQAKGAFSNKLLDKFNLENSKGHFDLFFSYLTDGMIEPGVIDEIRKKGVFTCNFSCNNTHQFDLVDGLSPHFDISLHAERDVRDKFLEIGANPMWWPMASNPKYFKPLDVPRIYPVSFVGGNYALRARYISYLLERGIDVFTFGPGWNSKDAEKFESAIKEIYLKARALFSGNESDRDRYAALHQNYKYSRDLLRAYPHHFSGLISDDEMIYLYSASDISLGFLEVFDNHDPSSAVLRHLHLREFEAPMCGALYVTGYSDELSQMFEPDKEVVVYKDVDELAEKVQYFISHPNQAEEIRQAGHARALQDHTYHKRFASLITAVGLS